MKQLIQNALHQVGYQLNRWSNHRKVMRGLLGRDNPVIFDVGASTGDESIEYRKIFPRAGIHDFDPVPSSFRILQQRLKKDLDITTHNLIFSEVEELIPFIRNAAPACSSLLPTDDIA